VSETLLNRVLLLPDLFAISMVSQGILNPGLCCLGSWGPRVVLGLSWGWKNDAVKVSKRSASCRQTCTFYASSVHSGIWGGWVGGDIQFGGGAKG
jgi:hypothetical protein